MRKVILTLAIICACIHTHAQMIITTVAGTGSMGYNGDNQPAIDAKLNYPEGICLDYLGNLYIADAGNSRVRKVNLSTGIITTVAGNGIPGYVGDNHPATDAELKAPVAVFLEKTGNILIADGFNYAVRRLNVSTGIITTVAGNGTMGYSGDGFAATDATFNAPTGVCEDKHGNIYIVDRYNNRVRKVDTAGIVTTVAGTGAAVYNGDNGLATDAGIDGPVKIWLDTADNLIFSEDLHQIIRKVIVSTGIITTIAGTGGTGSSGNGGLATNAQIGGTGGVYVDNDNNIYIACLFNGVIRRIDGATGIISTVAGCDTAGYSGDGGPALRAKMACNGVHVDNQTGDIYIADFGNHRIRRVYNTVGVAEMPTIEVKAYPNPAKDNLTIEQAKGSSVQIFDLNGKLVVQTKIMADKENLDIDKLTPGAYLMEIINARGVRKTHKLVISK